MTPEEIVSHMIDLLNLSEFDKKNKLFLENSCGDGRFIKGLVKIGVPKENIYACDIGPEISVGIKDLIPESNFYLGSYFDKTEWIGKFDYVIGNPPYVRIHNIPEDQKKVLKNFNFCFGMYDLYYAFFEFGLKCLREGGKLIYITPSSYILNKSGEKMRDYFAKNGLIDYFEDLSSSKKFPGYSTYSCITLLNLNSSKSLIPWAKEYQKVGIPFESLQNGLATLSDKIFIKEKFDLEEGILRPIFKASKGETLTAIYPYINGKPMEEEFIKQNFPKAYEYLLKNKEALLARSIVGSTKWYEYGRSQGLKNMDKEKIAITTTVSFQKLNFYRLPANYLVYSGLYATGDLSEIEKYLDSEELLSFLIERGKPMSGNYVQIGSTLLKEY